MPDITVALDAVGRAGYHPFGTRLGDVAWQETYLHPRETRGVLIQLVQADEDVPGPLAGTLEELLDQADAIRAVGGHGG